MEWCDCAEPDRDDRLEADLAEWLDPERADLFEPERAEWFEPERADLFDPDRGEPDLDLPDRGEPERERAEPDRFDPEARLEADDERLPEREPDPSDSLPLLAGDPSRSEPAKKRFEVLSLSIIIVPESPLEGMG